MGVQQETKASMKAWTSTQAYGFGVICLIVGGILGALVHGPAKAVVSPEQVAGPAAAVQQQMPPQGARQAGGTIVNPLDAQLQKDPNNVDLLSKAGNMSMEMGDPKGAIGYYERALKVKENEDVRVNLGNAYFESGDADHALAEFAAVLKADPKNDKALFNTGAVKWRAKQDPKGAVEAWQAILKYYPNHPHKDQVKQMIARAKEHADKGLN